MLQLREESEESLYEEIDNIVWSRREEDLSRWCQQNKVFDEITEVEIEEIWRRAEPDQEEPVRLNGKYVWQTAKRVCNFINEHEELINITSFGEYPVVMKKIMAVIKEAHSVERKRRQTAKKKKSDDSKARFQRAKALIARIKQGRIEKDEIARTMEEIFGKGSHKEIENVTAREKIVERIDDVSKTEQQFEEWETMRHEAKRKQREDRRLNLFWRRNKTFPKQFGEVE